MPRTPARKKSKLEDAIKQRRDALRAELKSLDALSKRIEQLQPLELEPPPKMTVNNISEVEAAMVAFRAIEERNKQRKKQYENEYDALLKEVQGHLKSSQSRSSRRSQEAPKEPSETPTDHDDEQQAESEGERQSEPSPDRSSFESPKQGGSSNPVPQPEITFDEVYKDGAADPKDTIVEYPRKSGEYYVLRCNQCKIPPFAPRDPLRAARKHLDTEAHGYLHRSNENAIEQLGIRVVGCSEPLADKNNKEYIEWFVREYPQRSNSNKRKKKDEKRTSREFSGDTAFQEHSTTPGDTSANKRQRITHVQPADVQAGKLFCCDNKKGIYMSVVVILPMFTDWPEWKIEVLDSTESIGWWETPQLKPPKDCFEFVSGVDAPRGWKPDYRDDGPRVSERLYPAIYIEGDRWDTSCTALDYVELGELRPFEKYRVVPENIKGAEDYTRKMKELERQHGSVKGESRICSMPGSVADQHYSEPQDPPAQSQNAQENEQPQNHENAMDVEKEQGASTQEPRNDLPQGDNANTRPAQAVAMERGSETRPSPTAAPERSLDSATLQSYAAGGMEMTESNPSSATVSSPKADNSTNRPPLSIFRTGSNGANSGRAPGGKSPHTSRPVARRSYGVSWDSPHAQACPPPISVDSSDAEDENEDLEDIPSQPPPFTRVKSDIKSPRSSDPFSSFNPGVRTHTGFGRPDMGGPPGIRRNMDAPRAPTAFSPLNRTNGGSSLFEQGVTVSFVG